MSRIVDKKERKLVGPSAHGGLDAMQPRRPDQKAETKARILNAACKLMAEKDFSTTTIDMIMEAAGLGRATFYLHFANKSHIVEEAAIQVQAKIRSLCEELAAFPVRDEAMVVSWMRRLVDMMIEQRIYVHVMTQFYTVDAELRLGGNQWHMLVIESLACTNKIFAMVLDQPVEHRMLTARAHIILFALERFIIYNVLENGGSDYEACITMLGQDLYQFMELA